MVELIFIALATGVWINVTRTMWCLDSWIERIASIVFILAGIYLLHTKILELTT